MEGKDKHYPGKMLYEEIRDGKSLMSPIREAEEEEKAKPESERVPVDTYGCDCIFLGSFVSECDDMNMDFTLIARDFLKLTVCGTVTGVCYRCSAYA